jgi:hypothetical protein
MNEMSLLMIGRARQAYSTSPRSAKITSKSMPSVALCRLAGLKDFVEFADVIENVVVAVLAPPSFRFHPGVRANVATPEISYDNSLQLPVYTSRLSAGGGADCDTM